MNSLQVLFSLFALAPFALMIAALLLTWFVRGSPVGLWRLFQTLSATALILAGIAIWEGPSHLLLPAGLKVSSLSLLLTFLVQFLCTVIGGFSARYLQGEVDQRRYITSLAAVLAGVHLLLMADHWLILILSWSMVGVALEQLLCFYPDRAFARLAAHKKRIADRVADALLIVAAAAAWMEIGSGSLSALWAHLAREGMSVPLQISAMALVLAVVLRTAMLPAHGWLIQVMESPTPVSALMHAGVVNLGGFVLIRFAPLLEQATPARAVLLLFGLSTAVLAGMVMLTRISIKVRLAWSTVAQMGFMMVECAVGLYSLAALHLIGHSLYKANAFLSASTIVRQTRLQALHPMTSPSAKGVAIAPVFTISIVLLVLSLSRSEAWPWWWSAVLGLAWAPILWLPTASIKLFERTVHTISGLLIATAFTVTALLCHVLPLGTLDTPHHWLGLFALLGMVSLYLCLAVLQIQPQLISTWRRWSYAGFYVDEAYTKLALKLWPTRWMPERSKHRTSPTNRPCCPSDEVAKWRNA